MGSFWGLMHSSVILLALCFIYDTFGVYGITDKKARDFISGVLVGLIGIAVMLAPWSIQPGVFFDTRWVLLSLCGLFFGFVPTSIAVAITGTFRLIQGGPGAMAGTVVIVVTACIGLAWRFWRGKSAKSFGWKELYVFGVLIQLAVLSCMLLLPADIRFKIVKTVAPPILVIYPIITMLVGLILKRQEIRRDAENELIENRKALSKERGLLRGVINAIPDLIFFKSTGGKYLGCNKSFEAFAGHEEAYLLGKTDAELFDAETATFFQRKDSEMLATGNPASNEGMVVYPDGSEVLLDTLKTPFKGLDGILHGLVGVSRDITERKEAEEQIKHSRDFLQTVIDGFPEQMMVVNADYTIAMANKSAGMAVCKTPADLIGLRCFEVSHKSAQPCHSEDHICPLKEVMETKASVTVEHIHYDHQGRGRNIELAAAPIFDDKGEVVQIIESSRDITARREAEQAKLRLERQVHDAQKLESLGVLAGGIAHDFNNILMGVLGNAELAMMKMSPNDPAVENLKSIETAAVRAGDLAKQMLAYSGKGRFVVGSLNVNHMVEEMINLLKTTISKTAVLKLNLSQDIPSIDADIIQVRQVFMNLITNASETIGDTSGVITVNTGTMAVTSAFLEGAIASEDVVDGNYVFFEVSDTGSGMDRETRARLFDPFFTTKFTGRGLGMAATLGIIRGHKGAIRVDSEPDVGTTVRVLFPHGEEPHEAAPGDGGGSPKAETWPGRGTILVVDDDEAIRLITKDILTEHGFKVLLAEDGDEGVRILSENLEAITLVLLDMTMPRMGGEEAFTEMRKIHPDVQVILSSGYNEQEATNRFMGKGLAGFIHKPYRPSELIEAFHKLLRKKEAT